MTFVRLPRLVIEIEKLLKSECKITDWYRNIRKSRKVKVLLQTFGNPKFAPRDL